MEARSPLFIHYVADMERAIRFYTGVFKAPVAFRSPGWTTLEFEGFQLALHIWPADRLKEALLPNAGLCLLVDSIEDFQQAIESRGGSMDSLREPEENVPVRVGSFRDPEGNGFDLRQEVRPA